VKTQIWIAVSVYVLVAIVKKRMSEPIQCDGLVADDAARTIRRCRIEAVHKKVRLGAGDEEPFAGCRIPQRVILIDGRRLSEAEPLYRRALAITEKSYGPDHPNTQTVRENLQLLQEQLAGSRAVPRDARPEARKRQGRKQCLTVAIHIG
jgi:hypothetical protein